MSDPENSTMPMVKSHAARFARFTASGRLTSDAAKIAKA